jgi:hypothetical protein
VQGVFNAGFLFFHFDFGGSADLDHGHSAQLDSLYVAPTKASVAGKPANW